MNHVKVAVFSILLVLAFTGCQEGASKPQSKELVIYAYDSFVSEWGLGPQIIPLFEEMYQCKVTLLSKGDGAQVLSALEREKSEPRADVVIGLDDMLLGRVLASDILEPYVPKGFDQIPPALDFDPSHHLIPFDYGYFTLIWDSEKLAVPPISLADLARPEFAGKLILMDPRTSTPGLGFLAQVVASQGDNWSSFWKSIAPSILTIAPGWDSGYGLFTKGEAPLVLSYTTSPAYHVEYDKTDRYKALDLAEGHVRQVEGLGLVKGSKHPDLARAFVDFAISPAFQEKIPLYQWMYPVLSSVTLPESYKAALIPAKVLAVDQDELSRALAQWTDLVVE